MITTICDDSDWPDKLRDEWSALVDVASEATPFQTWEWQSSWWRHYGRGKRPHIVLVHEGETLVGLMPLVRVGGPWTSIRAMGGGPSDYLHPLARPGFEEAVARSVVEHIRSLEGVDLLDLHQVRDDRALAGKLPSSYAMSQARCLVLELPKSYDAFVQSLSKSLRYDVRRMDKPGFAATVRTLGPEEVPRGLDDFFETHRMRWRKRGLPGAFVGRRIQAFHRDWVSLAAAKGWVWLSVLELEGRTVGTLYAMRLHGTCYFYQAGFDPACAALSPGTVLVAHTVRRAIEEGLLLFDFLRGDEPYKRRWKPLRVHENLRYLQARDSVLGRLGQTWNETGARVEGKIRERLEGKGLR